MLEEHIHKRVPKRAVKGWWHQQWDSRHLAQLDGETQSAITKGFPSTGNISYSQVRRVCQGQGIAKYFGILL